jgi:hypothetical protein
MTRRDPHAPGESPGSRLGIWLAVVLGFAFVVAVLCLATYVADRIGASL